MSTLEGHSALQALHSKQRSMTSCKRLPVNSSFGTLPERTERNALALPRVECSSSRVPMYDGHMVPSSFLRHSPMPLHISTARTKPPCSLKSRVVRGSQVLYCGLILSDSVIDGESTTFPGFIRLFESKARFTWRKASYNAGPKSLALKWLRANPSPCSPDIAPSNSRTKSQIALAMETIFFISLSSLRLMSGRMCMHPTEQ